ncbi:outer membrane protein [Ignatzschineria larvae DSM 13226]|uniref:Outer membrane protein n=1 Tax=Ignatzschineria larvae DSM 13226 TaxID=1111732 RepID=A0ABZ3C0B7_9GAMM|nr:outer membrane protein [Ignatzschineria larvae]
MKKLLIASAISLLGFTSTAFAMDFEQYVSAKAVLNHVNNKFETDDLNLKKSKNVGGFRLAYGVAFPVDSNKIRTELEYGYNGKVKLGETIDDEHYNSETKSQSVMVNAYFDFNTDTAFTPYVGAGIGYARLKNTIDRGDTSWSKSSNNFAWNVGAGVSYAVNRDVDIDLSYRYADYGDVKHSYSKNSEGKVKQRGNEFNLGVRFNF